jgi:TonB family protein
MPAGAGLLLNCCLVLTDKSMTVNVLIGREGRVKQAKTYSPVDSEVEDAALTAATKWTFQPQTVDGVPAQISTSFTLPFPPDYQKVDASQPDARPMFDRMRTAGDLRLEGAPAFHMKANFHSEDGSAKAPMKRLGFRPRNGGERSS